MQACASSQTGLCENWKGIRTLIYVCVVLVQDLLLLGIRVDVRTRLRLRAACVVAEVVIVGADPAGVAQPVADVPDFAVHLWGKS